MIYSNKRQPNTQKKYKNNKLAAKADKITWKILVIKDIPII